MRKNSEVPGITGLELGPIAALAHTPDSEPLYDTAEVTGTGLAFQVLTDNADLIEVGADDAPWRAEEDNRLNDLLRKKHRHLSKCAESMDANDPRTAAIERHQRHLSLVATGSVVLVAHLDLEAQRAQRLGTGS